MKKCFSAFLLSIFVVLFSGISNANAAELKRELYVGCSGEDVKTVQHMLNVVLNENLDEDGDYGFATEQVVYAYQNSRNSLVADGITGPLTFQSLQADFDAIINNSNNQQLVKNGVYVLFPSYNSKLAIGEGKKNNIELKNYSKNDSSSQWKIICIGNNVYTLTNMSTTKVLSVDEHPGSGSNVYGAKYVGHGGQLWSISADGNGCYTFKPFNNGSVALDVKGAGGKKGSNIQSYTVNFSKAQSFNLKLVKEVAQCKTHAYNSVYGDICSKCGKYYDTGATEKPMNCTMYVVNDNTPLRSFWYDRPANVIRKLAAGTPVKVIGVVTNSLGNRFYHTSEGYYIYGSRLTTEIPVNASYTVRFNMLVSEIISGRSEVSALGDSGAKYWSWYYGAQSDRDDSWCAVYVSYILENAGISSQALHSANPNALLLEFKKSRAFHPASETNYQKSPGDVVFYGYSNNFADHVAIVADNNGKVLHGNYSRKVVLLDEKAVWTNSPFRRFNDFVIGYGSVSDYQKIAK